MLEPSPTPSLLTNIWPVGCCGQGGVSCSPPWTPYLLGVGFSLLFALCKLCRWSVARH